MPLALAQMRQRGVRSIQNTHDIRMDHIMPFGRVSAFRARCGYTCARIREGRVYAAEFACQPVQRGGLRVSVGDIPW